MLRNPAQARDPGQDIERYLDAASAEGMRIVAAAETHIHADFLSGCRALAARAGVSLDLSGEGGETWQYRYARAYPHRLLYDGDSMSIDRVKLQALHTPGHTPERLAFLLTDGAVTRLPMGVFSGDCVFVGDVDWPVLLQCQTGVGSGIVASVLARRGHSNVSNLVGGYRAWSAARLPIVGR